MEIPSTEEVLYKGYSIVPNLYTQQEINAMINCIEHSDKSNDTFRKNKDIFAIRQIMKELPELKDLIFNNKLRSLIREGFGKDYFMVKSIYFDKPPSSNWYVAYHQDLTISVLDKTQVEGFENWTKKQNQYAVQPTMDILENIFTIRIHLDDTNEKNGALRVIPQSHTKGILRQESINWETEQEITCIVEAGGVMIMKPLLQHSSSRTINNKRRRVIHLEFSNITLPSGLEWSEKSLN